MQKPTEQKRWAPSDAGMVLPVTLMLLALLAALTLQAHIAARSRLAREQRAGTQARLRVMACDAAWQSLQMLAEETATVTIIHTNAAWAAPGAKPCRMARLFVQVSDAASLFNVNNGAARPRIASAAGSGCRGVIIRRAMSGAGSRCQALAGLVCQSSCGVDRRGFAERRGSGGADAGGGAGTLGGIIQRAAKIRCWLYACECQYRAGTGFAGCLGANPRFCGGGAHPSARCSAIPEFEKFHLLRCHPGL